MMNWNGGGMGTGAWLLMGLFWFALIAGIVWLVARLLPENAPRGHARETNAEILDRRFAQGEMDVDTYEAQRVALTDASGGRR